MHHLPPVGSASQQSRTILWGRTEGPGKAPVLTVNRAHTFGTYCAGDQCGLQVTDPRARVQLSPS